MMYIKAFIITLIWMFFIKSSVFMITKISFKERFIAQMSDITDEAVSVMSSVPCSAKDIISEKKGPFTDYLYCTNKDKYADLDEDLKALATSFESSFNQTDSSSVKVSLSRLRQRIDTAYSTVTKKKEEIFRTKLVLNILLPVGITIIII